MSNLVSYMCVSMRMCLYVYVYIELKYTKIDFLCLLSGNVCQPVYAFVNQSHNILSLILMILNIIFVNITVIGIFFYSSNIYLDTICCSLNESFHLQLAIFMCVWLFVLTLLSKIFLNITHIIIFVCFSTIGSCHILIARSRVQVTNFILFCKCKKP